MADGDKDNISQQRTGMLATVRNDKSRHKEPIPKELTLISLPDTNISYFYDSNNDRSPLMIYKVE